MRTTFATSKPVVFVAMSKRNFYFREHIVKYVLEEGFTPSCAFMMYSYFLLDTVDRKRLIDANNDLIKRSDMLWVFGDISDGVEEEIKLAKRLNMPVKYFDIDQEKNRLFQIKKTEAKLESR